MISVLDDLKPQLMKQCSAQERDARNMFRVVPTFDFGWSRAVWILQLFTLLRGEKGFIDIASVF